MRLFNTTPYAFLPYDCSPAPTLPAMSVIIKGTFELRPDAPAAALSKERQERMRGDEMHLDDLGRSLAYATDLVAAKPRAEALVSAVCYTPDGRPRSSVDVSVLVQRANDTRADVGRRGRDHHHSIGQALDPLDVTKCLRGNNALEEGVNLTGQHDVRVVDDELDGRWQDEMRLEGTGRVVCDIGVRARLPQCNLQIVRHGAYAADALGGAFGGQLAGVAVDYPAERDHAVSSGHTDAGGVNL